MWHYQHTVCQWRRKWPGMWLGVEMRTTPFAEFLILPTGPTVTSPLLLVLRVIFVTDLLLFCVLSLSCIPLGLALGHHQQSSCL